MKKVIVGEGLRIHKRLDIRGPGTVSIGNNCVIDGMRGNSCHFVTLYTLNSQATINIKDNVSLFAARISSRFSVNIGNNVIIEESGIADTDFHSLDISRELPLNEEKETCQVTIGDKVSIAARSIIMKGVAIGSHTIVGPGSIVSRSLPSRSFVLGNPAKVVKILKDDEPTSQKYCQVITCK